MATQTREATTTREAIQAFLDRMARSLTAGDGKAVAAMWETPAFVVGDEMAQCVATQEELAEFFGSAKEQYNQRGIQDTRAEILSFEPVGKRIAVAKVRWPYLDASGKEVGAETSTYTFRTDDAGELRLRIATMHGEAR